jgi:[acyl-carrier-protein] S-malonyltransferase
LQKLKLQQGEWMAGHSLGEYAALVAANAISLANAAKLVQKRAELMQATIPVGKGGMAAIVGMTEEQVQDICLRVSTPPEEQVTPANWNAIGQVVIAGHMPAIRRAIELAEKEGARLAMVIPVSVPCHCPLLADAATAFEEHLALAPFTVPNTNVISNVDLSVYQSVEQIRKLLKEQLVMPVRWVEIIQMIKSKGIDKLIESGPGKVLGGLVKRIDKSMQVISVHDAQSLEQCLKEFQ